MPTQRKAGVACGHLSDKPDGRGALNSIFFLGISFVCFGSFMHKIPGMRLFHASIFAFCTRLACCVYVRHDSACLPIITGTRASNDDICRYKVFFMRLVVLHTLEERSCTVVQVRGM